MQFYVFFYYFFPLALPREGQSNKEKQREIISWSLSNNMKGKRVKSFVSFGSNINHVNRSEQKSKYTICILQTQLTIKVYMSENTLYYSIIKPE